VRTVERRTVVALEVVLSAGVDVVGGRRRAGGGAVGAGAGAVGAGQLVRAVAAVVLAVALPPERHAVVVVALEHGAAAVALQ